MSLKRCDLRLNDNVSHMGVFGLTLTADTSVNIFHIQFSVMAMRQTPLTCSGHTRPVVDLAFSGITPYGYFLISACKGNYGILMVIWKSGKSSQVHAGYCDITL